MKSIVLIITAVFLVQISKAQDKINPSFEDVLSLRSVSNAMISPDGKHVLYQMQTVDWEENRYDRELWISKDDEEPFQLTNNLDNNSSSPKWSPEGKWIAFMSNRGEKNQIHAIRTAGGESFQVTNTESNISSFEWSPDGQQIAFLQSEDKTKTDKKREDKYGGYAVEDAEYSLNQIWITDFDPTVLNQRPLPDQLKDSVYTEKLEAKLLLDSVEFSVNSYKWSPDGKSMAIEHQPDPLRNTFFKANISIVNMETKTIQPLVSNPSYDGLISWSPDGKSILYQSSLNDTTSNYYKNGKLFRIDHDGSNSKLLAPDFDENLSGVRWTNDGIFAMSWQKTKRPMVRVDPISGAATVLSIGSERIYNFSFSEDGKHLAYSAAGDNDLREVYHAAYPSMEAQSVTTSTHQLDSWSVAQSEVIAWPSEDGQEIEGVLHKPQDYDPNKKYPLFVIIHGGPTGISTPEPARSYVYPIIQWLNKGALVLRPNYRGSAGYGEKFRSLNVRNLGVGDAWDVLSGVKHLKDEGMIDADKVACMGWSQGGYISAFLTTNSDLFQAFSVGAGISNWMTYYVNTDIHPFTRQYLKGTPWSDKAVYEKTSPMTNINKASTPTLIQHGEFDKRVPVANAYELFQGLQDVDVETKLIIYKGFGHGITKPKERLAATWHNWQWFAKHIWDEEIELPEE